MSAPQTTTNSRAWMALTAALLGWMFDGAEMGLFSMVGRQAIRDLMQYGPAMTPDQESELGLLFGVVIAVFLVGAATGGVVFGWLGDRIGRVRAMSLSVITYALFTGLCGLVSDPLQLAVLRFIASLGMGGEWSLGVALVMEVWPNRSRALMAGLIGAAANVGYLLVGVMGLGLNSVVKSLESFLISLSLSTETVDWLTRYDGWRILMLMGAVPALLTFFIRLFVPESEKWQEEHKRGTTSHWKTYDLLGVLIGSLGPALMIAVWLPPKVYGLEIGNHVSAEMWTAVRVIGSILGIVIATVGYTWPVVKYVRRSEASGRTQAPVIRRMLLAASLSGVALLGTWGSAQWGPSWSAKLTDAALKKGEITAEVKKSAPAYTQICMAAGAIVGTIAAALAGGAFGRRPTYFFLCVTSLVTLVFFYQYNTAFNTTFLVTTFIASVFTASFYGWLPLYLPELFGTNVRASCQGFSFNFGRIIAAIGTLQTGALFSVPDVTWGGHTFTGGHPLACSVMALIYVVGMGLIWFVPETRGQPLPD